MFIQSFHRFNFNIQGFESRGTEISVRLTTWDNLLEYISHVGPLTTNPIQPMTAASKKRKRGRKQKKKKEGRRSKGRVRREDVYVSDILDQGAETPLERWRRDTASPVLSSDHRIAWLCGDPSKPCQIITITLRSSVRVMEVWARMGSNLCHYSDVLPSQAINI